MDKANPLNHRGFRGTAENNLCETRTSKQWRLKARGSIIHQAIRRNAREKWRLVWRDDCIGSPLGEINDDRERGRERRQSDDRTGQHALLWFSGAFESKLLLTNKRNRPVLRVNDAVRIFPVLPRLFAFVCACLRSLASACCLYYATNVTFANYTDIFRKFFRRFLGKSIFFSRFQ